MLHGASYGDEFTSNLSRNVRKTRKKCDLANARRSLRAAGGGRADWRKPGSGLSCVGGVIPPTLGNPDLGSPMSG